MDYKNIIVNLQYPKATITINRPEVLNAMNWDTFTDLQTAFTNLENDKQVRVIVLTANGRAFSAGNDLLYLKSIIGKPAKIMEYLHLIHGVHNYMERMSKPIIAALNGITLAGGLELAIACDIIIAADTAIIGDQHANYGIVPGGGASQRLPRLIGVRRAKELIFTGSRLTAAEAERIGLINRIVPADKLMESANELADKLGALSPMATKSMKYLINQGMQVDIYTGLDLEIGAIFQHMYTEDYQEGLSAFKEKRKPNFPGK